VYEEVGGHAAVRDNITEDVALMRLMKAAGKRCRLYYGTDFASTRMHTTLRSMFNGWARIYSGVTERRALPIFAMLLFVLISGLGAYVMLAVSLAALATGIAVTFSSVSRARRDPDADSRRDLSHVRQTPGVTRSRFRSAAR
jgi:hypothetical protein